MYFDWCINVSRGTPQALAVSSKTCGYSASIILVDMKKMRLERDLNLEDSPYPAVGVGQCGRGLSEKDEQRDCADLRLLSHHASTVPPRA